MCIVAVIKRVNLKVTENKNKILVTKRILLNLDNYDKSIRKTFSCNRNSNKNKLGNNNYNISHKKKQ